MINNLSRKLYTAKDIEKYLGINSNKLYHWVQTKRLLTPTMKGIGRGKSNYFSLEDLATLSLIKVLDNHRIDLWEIKNILSFAVSSNPERVYKVKVTEFDDTKGFNFVDKNGEIIAAYGVDEVNIWELYKLERKLFNDIGFLLRIYMPMDSEERGHSVSFSASKMRLFAYKSSPVMMSCMVIDLVAIIKNLEEKTELVF